ncbi:DUF1127 domain-containing protein [Devosia sp.]|uniref:DUF1127 domain-containing protein n=1 Tax=Devosia sp. TaxID=1871048 RepID=UPI003264214A
MAFSLYSERPIVAATSTGFVASVQIWFAKAAAARTRRTALATLLELENFRLDDLGISREDVTDALRDPTRSAGRRLAFKRSVRASL